MVLGNKTDVDLPQEMSLGDIHYTPPLRSKIPIQREVSLQEGLDLAKQHEVIFFEVSALQNVNIDRAMKVMSEKLYEQFLIMRMRRLDQIMA